MTKLEWDNTRAVFLVLDRKGQPIPLARIEIVCDGLTVFRGLCDSMGCLTVHHWRESLQPQLEGGPRADNIFTIKPSS